MLQQTFFTHPLKFLLYGVFSLFLSFNFVGCTKATPSIEGADLNGGGTSGRPFDIGNNGAFGSSGGFGSVGSTGNFGATGATGVAGSTGTTGGTGVAYIVDVNASPSLTVNVGSSIILTASARNATPNGSFEFTLLSPPGNGALNAIVLSNGRIQITSSVAASFDVRATLNVTGSQPASSTVRLTFLGAPPAQLPNLAGTWFIGSRICTILQSGSSLSLTNEIGSVSNGYLSSPTMLVAYQWNNLSGVISADAQTIQWANNTRWSRFSDGSLPLLLASKFVGQAESSYTPSPYSSNLATPDSVDFSIPMATTAIISYTASVNAGGSYAGDCFDSLVIDGQTVSSHHVTQTYNAQHHFQYSVILNPGPHNITVAHATNNSLICTWSNRMLTVMGANNANPVLIGSYVNPSIENTSAQYPNYANFSNPDSLTFSLLQSTVATVNYSAVVLLNGTDSAGDCYDALYVDGALVTHRSVSSRSGANTEHNLSYSLSLSAGTHTIAVRHAANNSLSCSYKNRALTVLSMGAPNSPLLASQFIAQSQGTNAQGGQFASLATDESVTFSVSQPTHGIISYGANAYLQGTTAAECIDALYVDGALIYSSSQSHLAATNAEQSLSYVARLAVGSHTVSIKHAASNGSTCNWSNRMLTVVKAF